MKVVLVILDGWGHNSLKQKNDAIEDSECKNMRILSCTDKSMLVHASGIHVGLPEGVMGNSEVGHLTIGSGRILKQNVVRINEAIKSGTIVQNLKKILCSNNENIHLIGMISNGGVHSHIDHLKELCKYLHKKFKNIYIHCISDGRDTAPNIFLSFYNEINKLYINCEISSVSGRYYAMDRDNNKERTDKYFECLTQNTNTICDIKEYVQSQYEKGNCDETLEPAFCQKGKVITTNDKILFFNFRSDRMRQLAKKFVDNKFYVFTLTEYDKTIQATALFYPIDVKNTLADVLEQNNIEQIHIAETEKYAHATYFFNGGRETTHRNEKHIIIDSVKTDSFDIVPEMSCKKITEEIIKNMQNDSKFIVANYAAADMVGHTGSYKAVKKSINCIDEEIGRIHKECLKHKYVLIITADHGNAECIVDVKTGQICKTHTANKVPLIICDKEVSSTKLNWGYQDSDFGLKDVAPTILNLLGIDKPDDMTGRSVL